MFINHDIELSDSETHKTLSLTKYYHNDNTERHVCGIRMAVSISKSKSSFEDNGVHLKKIRSLKSLLKSRFLLK